tara:strand:- start:44 stop:205 length:162 start_codon:yes stop_codon:yes gene_type:complete
MPRYFKKDNSYIVTYDEKNHSESYLETLKSKFTECKEDGSSLKAKKTTKKKSK